MLQMTQFPFYGYYYSLEDTCQIFFFICLEDNRIGVAKNIGV